MRKTLYRRFGEDNLRTIIEGDGNFLEDDHGSDYLDLSGGPGVACLGYNNSFVINTIKKQMDRISFVFSGSWASEAADVAGRQLYKMFEESNPGWFGKCLFQGGGSEAVDLACKIAVQYAAEAGENRNLFAAVEYGFHGVTTLPFSLTDNYPRYALMDDYQSVTRGGHVLRIRHPLDCQVDVALVNAARAFKSVDNKVAAVIVEPVGGPPVGAAPLGKDFLTGLRCLCDETGALLIYDEVFCGSGRCGYMSVAELYGVWPDITILGKSLTGGYQPMSAIVISAKVAERLRSGSGFVMWGTTYGAHTLGCAAVAATLRYVHKHNLLDVVRGNEPRFRDIANKILIDPHDFAVDLHCTGHLLGFRLIDPLANGDLPASIEMHAKVRREALDAGVIVYSKGGTLKGSGDFIIMAPAFEMSESEFSYGVTVLAKAMRDVYAREVKL